MRLIDADALELGKFIDARTDWHKGWNDALDAATTQAPTIDAVQVVHGRWVYEKTYQGMKYVCSECGEIPECFEPNYCPNCGAKMDGERKNDGK